MKVKHYEHIRSSNSAEHRKTLWRPNFSRCFDNDAFSAMAKTRIEHTGEAEFRNTFRILTWDQRLKNYKSRVLKDKWTLIGYMNDPFRNNTPNVWKKVVRKSRNETRTCKSVCYSRSWSAIMAFETCYFAAVMPAGGKYKILHASCKTCKKCQATYRNM